MPSQHANPSRSFRPDIPGEYDPALAELTPRGWDMSQLLRSVLRWVRDDPTAALAALTPYRRGRSQKAPKRDAGRHQPTP